MEYQEGKQAMTTIYETTKICFNWRFTWVSGIDTWQISVFFCLLFLSRRDGWSWKQNTRFTGLEARAPDWLKATCNTLQLHLI